MLLTNGIWLSTDNALPRREGAALILDRDGVLIEDLHYISKPEDVRLEQGAVDLLKWARARGLAIVTITNQSGIARGLFDWAAFEAVERELARHLASHGLSLDLTVACPFHPDHTPGYGRAEAHWRKPGAGMIELAAKKLGFDPVASWMIGDRASDIGAARNALLAGAIHVLSGHGTEERRDALELATEAFRVVAARDLSEAQLRLSDVLSRC
ncbi:MAG TPA: HAD family hydrolase [Parvibaculum sp.]|jgi:D-glycero-D-manno-heptose 1,7-bisphosphate phosphatase